MNWTKVREFYGLREPFNFKVAIPLILNLCALFVVFLVGVFWFFGDGLRIGGVRFYFFLYISCLLAIAAAFSKVTKFSYIILVWCTIELGLGLGSHLLAKHGFGYSLCPQNTRTRTDPMAPAFIYHPLLQFVPRPNSRWTTSIDFGDEVDKARAAGIDVASLQGQELDFIHNSLGVRGKELTPGDLAKDLIFVYGGSTTYDIAVTQGHTWVERLESDLDNKYTVMNLGIPGHNTAEHLIQTAFYQDIVGKKPVCAVYYVGWNDIANAHIVHLDNAYADYHLLLEADRRPPIFLAKYSPLLLLANAMAISRFDTVPLRPQLFGKAPGSGTDEHLNAIFIDHIKAIAAINEARGVRTIFIGQILNRDWPDSPNEFMPLVGEEDFVPLTESLKSLLGSAAASISAKYIDPGITNFGGNDFVDPGHFTALGARKFAALVSREIGEYCR